MTYYDSVTGRVLHRYTTRNEPGGVLRVACKTRRASRCPACARVYRADVYQLLRAGLVGGKGVPVSVADHPALFLTLTAPGFGAVHTRRCRGRKPCPHDLSCTARHHRHDPRLGDPWCVECYDYAGSVLFNAVSPLLWKRFVAATRHRLGPTRLSYAKVAEYQRRGVVHFHAILRLDGPATTEDLIRAVRHAARAVSVVTPPAVLRWGTQLDLRPVTAGAVGYLAKYATKAAESTGTLDYRVNPRTDLRALPVREHARNLIRACFALAAVDGLDHLRLDRWAHMLGFGGHFSTKSRDYSTTLSALRADREQHARTVREGVAVTHWEYAGQGLSPVERLLTGSL